MTEENFGKCDYGCGQQANYQLNNGKYCCSTHYSKCPEIRRKVSEGLKKAYRKGKKDCSHLDGNRGWRKGKYDISNKELFSKDSEYKASQVRKRILENELFEYKCDQCGIRGKWEGKELILELDHINGDRNDHRLKNLRFLCPNCHSQSKNFRSKNIKNENKGKKKVSDKKFVECLENSENIYKALINVGLAPKGANYNRAYRLCTKYEISFNTECDICGKEFESSRALAGHKIQKHDKIKCENCDEKFAKSIYNKHYRACVRDNPN